MNNNNKEGRNEDVHCLNLYKSRLRIFKTCKDIK